MLKKLRWRTNESAPALLTKVTIAVPRVGGAAGGNKKGSFCKRRTDETNGLSATINSLGAGARCDINPQDGGGGRVNSNSPKERKRLKK